MKNKIFNVLSVWRCVLFCLSVLLVSSVNAQDDYDEVEIEVLQVRDNIYMLIGAGGNITVQTGEQGLLIVDTQFAPLSEKILTVLSELGTGELRYIINTHHHGDHVGGNALLKATGSTISGGNVGMDIQDAGQGAQIIAHENVVLRMAASLGEEDAPSVDDWPTSTYFTAKKDLYFNGEGIRILHQPDAHTDGDSIIHFRRSDVISVGDVYRTNVYPYIDRAAGGSIQGIIAAANNIVEMIIPVYGQDGGTLVIPGHGRLSDLGDVLNWRDMITIISERIQALINEGLTLEQVKTAKPTRDYDGRWGADSGFWTTEQFIEAVYQDLSE